jgi:hypothetical protein
MKESKQDRKQYLRKSMEHAHALQARYANMKSPVTQNVRNPFPMWQLVQTILPTIPHPLDNVKAKVRFKFTVLGKQMVKTEIRNMLAKDSLPADYWEKHALSFSAIVALLCDDGFICNRAGVRVALMNIGATSFRVKNSTGKKGAPICKYYLTPQS